MRFVNAQIKFVLDQYAMPEEHLAADEALLDLAERDGEGGFLRIWECDTYFVVLGHGKRVAEEIHEEACQRDGVRVLRRTSGGGSVLQGPGCLSYSLVFGLGGQPQLETATGTNDWIMTHTQELLAAVSGLPVVRDGCTDLAVGRRKFSGNAQRRKRRSVLFHGTILHAMELGRIGSYLREPCQRPLYRGERVHSEFVTNLGVDSNLLRDALIKGWSSGDPVGIDRMLEPGDVERLVESRYSQAAWNHKF